MLVLDLETLAIPDVETYIEPIAAPSNYKDPEKIKAYELDARNKAVESAALDVDLATIIAIGVWSDDWTGAVDAPEVKLLGDPGFSSEADLIDWCWDHVRAEGFPLITFNGVRYDVPLLLRRCLYLGIPCPQIQIDKYRHPDIVDVAQLLSYTGMLDWHSLSFYANRFQIHSPEQDSSGKEIAELWLTGEREAVRRKCWIDVWQTAALARRIHAVPTVSSFPQSLTTLKRRA